MTYKKLPRRKAGFLVMAEVKKYQSEQLRTTPVMGAIPLDEMDLRELSLRRIASSYSGGLDGFAKGGMSFSRSFIKDRKLDDRLINPLIEAGRARVVDRPGKGYFPGAGNAVVYLNEDASVQQSLVKISPLILQNATNFFMGNEKNIKGINIFPNTSSHGLKGVSIDVKRDEATGPTLSKLSWPVGRGMRLMALPDFLDAETFIDAEEAIGAYARFVGIASEGAVKSIKFYYDEDTYKVFLALTAGPTDNQKRLVKKQLQNSKRNADIDQVQKMASRIGRQARDIIAKALMDFFPWKDGVEVVFDEPYVDVDTENPLLTAYSGGMRGADNGIGAYTVGLSDMIIYDAKGNIIPMGTKIVPRGSPTFASGKNVKSKPFQSMAGMIPEEGVDITDKLDRPRPLKALALAYHDGMTTDNA